MTEPKLLLWAIADDGPGSLATGDSGNRYSIRTAGSGRNGSRVLRVNGVMIRRFESIREAKEHADRMEAERLRHKKLPIVDPQRIRDEIRAMVRNDPELTEMVKWAMERFWRRLDEIEKAKH